MISKTASLIVLLAILLPVVSIAEDAPAPTTPTASPVRLVTWNLENLFD